MKNDKNNSQDENLQKNTANNVLKSVNELQSQTKKQAEFASNSAQNSAMQNKNDDKVLFEEKNRNEPTFFMMNNNAPQQKEDFEPFLKDIPAYQKRVGPQLTSYGVAALVLAILALLCSIFLIVHIVVNPDMSNTESMDFLFYLFFVILSPVIGLIGGVSCSFAAAILGIVAITKSYKRTISWVGFAFGIIALITVIVLSGLYLLG